MKLGPWIHLHYIPVFVSGLCSLFIVGWLLWLMQFGIDLADEGFYLVWIDNPFKYNVSLTQFGFFYHPFYWLLDGRISALRQLNMLATFTLTFVLAINLLHTVFAQAPLSKLERFVFAAAMATGAFTFLRLWLPTPSYNWLCFQALLVAAIGIVRAEHEDTTSSRVGWVLIGVAGWMAFMAKPSSAAALAVCVTIYLLVAGKMRLRLIAICMSVTLLLLLCSAYSIDGSLELFMMRVNDAITNADIMGSGHSYGKILRIDSFDMAGTSRWLLCGGAALLCGLSIAVLSRRSLASVIAYLLQLGAATASLLIALGYLHPISDRNGYHQLFLLLVLVVAMLLNLSAHHFRALPKLTRAQWSLALMFVTLPYVFAFGSNNNYWFMEGLAGIFWVFAGLVLLLPLAAHPRFSKLLLLFGITVQFLTVCAIANGIAYPYYQTQLLYKNDARIQIGGKASMLHIAPTYADYIVNMRHMTQKAGFTKSTPVIDLSGHSPGVPYVLGGQNTSQAWIIGNFPGYMGSKTVAETMLRRTPCDELARAWVFVEPNGPVAISMNVLEGFGAHPVNDYKTVAQVKTPMGLAGFKAIQTQQFLKPARSYNTALNACKAARDERHHP